ncbi:SCO2322 family protein [Streptomyces sp. NBC_00286]|uniref:SCO2322 family protein n=1 Tax=Streptomyces sp. NBC_00286 TaxID=2975701 RepID=UPI002E295F95|nr:SCO2322 family protein [Streptomyces sp. NBC_00286]
MLGATGQAHAAGYRYWSFWDRDGDSWVYATQGPSIVRPSDGDVQGFRFSVSEDAQDAAKPRGAAEFATICAKTPAREDSKRVALVLDFGTSADAPSGETPPRARTACARVPEDATTADALATVAKPLRYDTNALLCAIAGYPRTGCGEPVSAAEPTTTPSATPRETSASAENDSSESGGGSGDQGPSLGLVAGIGAVAVLGAAAAWQTRRRRRD